MALTTEQKINLLILAGFEPRMHKGGFPRPSCPDKSLQRVHADGDVWGFRQRVSPGSFLDNYHESGWEHMQLDTCPDELIYQAIGAASCP